MHKIIFSLTWKLLADEFWESFCDAYTGLTDTGHRFLFYFYEDLTSCGLRPSVITKKQSVSSIRKQDIMLKGKQLQLWQGRIQIPHLEKIVDYIKAQKVCALSYSE